MTKQRPEFSEIKTFDAFNKWYWYRKELSAICRQLGLASDGTKQDLTERIKHYFKGVSVPTKGGSVKVRQNDAPITLQTPLLECGFAFNDKFRNYFAEIMKVDTFKFNADMATAWRQVKKTNDTTFTIQDLLDVYLGKRTDIRYDHSCCQWNQFLKDFCADDSNAIFKPKIKVASILWKKVRDSNQNKIYSKDLRHQYWQDIEPYRIDHDK